LKSCQPRAIDDHPGTEDGTRHVEQDSKHIVRTRAHLSPGASSRRCELIRKCRGGIIRLARRVPANNMPELSYQTVFQIGLGSFPWTFVLPFGLMTVIGCALIRFNGGKQIRLAVGWLVTIVSLLFILILNVVVVPEFIEAWHAYRSGNSSIIEGRIEDFHPMPALGPAEESFSVKGRTFSYNVLDSTPCFRNSPPHLGPIHSGLFVRIYYKDECIQRVDVRR
jgi:hypothetical protein